MVGPESKEDAAEGGKEGAPRRRSKEVEDKPPVPRRRSSSRSMTERRRPSPSPSDGEDMQQERCHVCRETFEKPKTDMKLQYQAVANARPNSRKSIQRSIKKPTCPLCEELLQAPPCLACGKRVRDAAWGDTEVYHENCRRCCSCQQVAGKDDVVKLAGKLLCTTCDHLFGRFFMPHRRAQGDRMLEAFQAWDANGSGHIEASELRRVMKALDPDFAETDLSKLMRSIDTNGNGLIEYEEFCEWIMQGSPMVIKEESFEEFVAGLMREAGKCSRDAEGDISEVQVRKEGVFFVLRNGTYRMDTTAVTSEELSLTILDPEEFVFKLECTEIGLILVMNTGRHVELGGKGNLFGPWTAPEGFHIVGLRTKPTDVGTNHHVVGIDVVPLAESATYDANAALRFAAEHSFFYTLQKLLAKAAINVNCFGPGEVTALMLAAQHGSPGAIGMLLTSKAKIDLTDREGWTALTYASRSGNSSIVDLLLEKNATLEGDAGNALTEALRHKHNAASRALLLAGFGPRAPGTFALEEPPDMSNCTLAVPTARPAPGTFSKPVTVELVYVEPRLAGGKGGVQAQPLADDSTTDPEGEPAVGDGEPAGEGDTPTQKDDKSGDDSVESKGEAAEPDGEPENEGEAMAAQERYNVLESTLTPVQIYYTLDGRDPFHNGRLYRGPLAFSARRTQLRVVAVQGSQRSVCMDAVFVVCHYAIPDDVVSGSVMVCGPSESQSMLKSSLAVCLDEPLERVQMHEDKGIPGDTCWLSVPVSDPEPCHVLDIDQSFSTVRGQKKVDQFTERFRKDCLKALGIVPENIKLRANYSSGTAKHRAGSIAVDFTLQREIAEDMMHQIADETSFFRTKALLRNFYEDGKLHMVALLETRLADPLCRNGILEELSKKAKIEKVISMGTGESGVVSVRLRNEEVKKLSSSTGKWIYLKNSIKAAFPNAIIGTPMQWPEQFIAQYTVDVTSRTRGGFGPEQSTVDGKTVVRSLNHAEFGEKLSTQLAFMQCPLSVTMHGKAASRDLSHLEFHLEWDFIKCSATTQKAIVDYLDGICMIYTGSLLAQVIDFRSAHEDRCVHDGEDNAAAAMFGRSICRAIKHSGDVLREGGGMHKMQMDLDALPLDVTDLYFVLAAFDCDDLSLFPNPSVEIHDLVMKRQLTEYSLASAGHTRGVVMCSLTRDRDHGKWVVHGLGTPTEGNARDYASIKATIAGLQERYLSWERRRSIVQLRCLHKCKQFQEDSVSEFAQFLWLLVGLPISIFQLVVKML